MELDLGKSEKRVELIGIVVFSLADGSKIVLENFQTLSHHLHLVVVGVEGGRILLQLGRVGTRGDDGSQPLDARRPANIDEALKSKSFDCGATFLSCSIIELIANFNCSLDDVVLSAEEFDEKIDAVTQASAVDDTTGNTLNSAREGEAIVAHNRTDADVLAPQLFADIIEGR